jgi:hypothetical protein
MKNVLNYKHKVFMKYPDTGNIMITGTIDGTVLSGRVDETTLGNTVRVLAYVDFLAH